MNIKHKPLGKETLILDLYFLQFFLLINELSRIIGAVGFWADRGLSNLSLTGDVSVITSLLGLWPGGDGVCPSLG